MVWVKLDDAYFRNRKTQAAGLEGRALHLAAACWSASALTDGVIPKGLLDVLVTEAGVSRKSYTVLVRVGLWHDGGDHWLIHDWQHYIKSKADVEKERERWRRAKRPSAVDSAVESREDSAVDSRRPVPDPFPSDLHLPPTPTVTRPDTAGKVIEILLAAERATANGVRSKAGWERTVRARLHTEHDARIAQLCHDYPSAPCDVIASAVQGHTASLRYYQPSEET